MSRGGFKINRTSYEKECGDRVDWLDAFAEQFAKTEAGKSAVQVARERDQQAQSIHDQISSIFNNPSQTVESKVKDMQERTGLTEYLKRVAVEQEKEGAFAKFGPKMEQDILSYLGNRVRNTSKVPEIQEDLFATFRQHGLQADDVNCADVARYINDLIVEEKKTNPTTDVSSPDLGLVDTTLDDDDNQNEDVFQGLMPQGD